MSGSPRIAVVTGANKGIGFAIVRNIALQYPKSIFNNGPLLIYLTARSRERGEEALRSIQSDGQLQKAKALASNGGLTEIRFHDLDISESSSIQHFSSFLTEEHPDGVDIVVNNAAVALDGFNSEVVDKTMACNYYGTLEATQVLLPHIRPGGRLVNVSSAAGHLHKYSKPLQEKLVAATTVPAVSALMESFKSAVAAGNEREQGWISAGYAVSKTGVIAMTRAIALEEKRRGGTRLINSCCPGYVSTDMTKQRGVLTPDRGAQTPLKLAVGDVDGISGEFWQRERVSEW